MPCTATNLQVWEKSVSAAVRATAHWRCRARGVRTPKDDMKAHPELAVECCTTEHEPVGYHVGEKEKG